MKRLATQDCANLKVVRLTFRRNTTRLATNRDRKRIAWAQCFNFPQKEKVVDALRKNARMRARLLEL